VRPGLTALEPKLTEASKALAVCGASIEGYENWSSDDWGEDDDAVTLEESVAVNLPHDEHTAELRLADVLLFADEAPTLRAPESFQGVASSKRWLFVLNDSHDFLNQASGFWDSAPWPSRHAAASVPTSVGALSVAVVRGFTPHALHVSSIGDVERHRPAWWNEDWFVEVLLDAHDDNSAVSAAQAYLFSLSTRLDVPFSLRTIVRIPAEGPDTGEAIASASISFPSSLDVPRTTSGYDEICSLYLNASCAEGPELQLFLAHKVFEFAQATVLRRQAHIELRLLLKDPAASTPTVEFIERLIGASGKFVSRTEPGQNALSKVLNECCTTPDLAPFAPASLGALKAATDKIPKAGIADLAKVIGDTRDAFAHAKSNLRNTKNESPPDELADLAQCSLIAAAQVVRWFAQVPEDERVVVARVRK